MSKIAFIFPGQGAQKAGMGKDFYEETKTGKEVFDTASGLLGFSMPELCFTENDRLDITEYTQAALVTTSIAMMKVLMERTGIRPDVSAGLSLGEYCALVAAKVMSEADAITTVRQRGILMQGEVPVGVGAMAAILALDASKIEEVLGGMEGVEIANYNCPGQIVISGLKEAVEEACVKLKEAGAKRRPNFNGCNPCGEILLDSNGLCNLTTVNVMAFVKDGSLDEAALLEAQRLSARAGYRMTCRALEMHRWNAVQQRDRLLGCSLTGCQDMVNATGMSRDQQIRLLES